MNDYIFDKEKIERLIRDFYISTGVAVVLYDKDVRVITGSDSYGPYCGQIRRCEECRRRCTESNLNNIRRADSTRRTVRYTCHAGNMEVITPVIYEDTVIAYLQIGQFRGEGAEYSGDDHPRRVAREMGLDEESTVRLYREVPVFSDMRVDALEGILKVIIRAFWEDGLISRRRSMLSVRVEDFISRNLGRKIGVEELCREFSLSRNALYRLFRVEFGHSVGEYILARRIERGAELLSKTALSVAEISDAAGFTDYNYFIRVFKNRMGKTPLRYRKENA